MEKRTIILILLAIGLAKAFGQEPTGLWMTYDNKTIYKDSIIFGGSKLLGLILDFNKFELRNIYNDSTIKIKTNLKKRKIKIESFRRRIRYEIFGKDSLLLKNKGAESLVFRPVNLNHPLKYSKEDIIEYFDNHNFEPINDYIKNIEFINSKYYLIVPPEKPESKMRLISSYDFYGYWKILEIEDNYFLIFRLGQTDKESLYQILSIDNEKVQLKALQEVTLWHELTELKTCL